MDSAYFPKYLVSEVSSYLIYPKITLKHFFMPYNRHLQLCTTFQTLLAKTKLTSCGTRYAKTILETHHATGFMCGCALSGVCCSTSQMDSTDTQEIAKLGYAGGSQTLGARVWLCETRL